MTIQQQGIYKVNYLSKISKIYMICSVLLFPYRLIPNNIDLPNLKSIKAMLLPIWEVEQYGDFCK